MTQRSDPDASHHLFEGPDGWRLAPEGGAVHFGERTAVIADVHLGYEWARSAGGDHLPALSLAQTRAKLARLLDRAAIDRLGRAGGRTAPCFVVGAGRIVLPAFSPDAAGWDVSAGALPAGWRPESLRCVAG